MNVSCKRKKSSVLEWQLPCNTECSITGICFDVSEVWREVSRGIQKEGCENQATVVQIVKIMHSANFKGVTQPTTQSVTPLQGMWSWSGDHTLVAWEHFNTFRFYFKHCVAPYCCLGFRFKTPWFCIFCIAAGQHRERSRERGRERESRERKSRGEEGAQQAAVVLSSFNWTFNNASGKTQRKAETASGSGAGGRRRGRGLIWSQSRRTVAENQKRRQRMEKRAIQIRIRIEIQIIDTWGETSRRRAGPRQ